MTFWCVGRNYADHAKELGNAIPESPLFFVKAGSCAVMGSDVHLPTWAKDVHHELEIALHFNSDLQFSKIALALDLTERTLQNQLKQKGSPWSLAKSFKNSCPLSEAIELSTISKSSAHALDQLELQLWVNKELKQKGQSQQMIFKPEELRVFALNHFPVEPGDWLLTGTPAGVGPVKNGNQLKGLLLHNDKLVLQANWQILEG